MKWMGRLVIESLFQLSSINPDCNDEMGEDVASLQIENASDEYLKSADIQVLLHDGTEFKFHMEDVPAGKKVLAFELENQVYDKKSGVKDITVEAEYSAEASLMEGQVSASVDEAGLKLENTSGEALQNLTVKYHCLFEEMYYGGRSYAKTIESLAPGESTVVDTSECYLGEAAVVSISK